MRLSDEAAELMRAGAVYIGGRDKNGLPSCIFCPVIKIVIFSTKPLKKVDKDTAMQLNECFTFTLVVLKKYCMTPKYAEKFNFIIDMDGKGLRPQIVFFFWSKKKGFDQRTSQLVPG
jgi:hypothetical protein